MSQRGSIRKRGETWTAYWFVAGPDGRRQRSKGGFRTKRAAQAHLTDVLGAVQAGTWQEPSKLTVGQYLVDHWLPGLDRRPTTLEQYRHMVEAWIVPALGSVPLAHLTPRQVADFYTVLRTAPRKDGRGTISSRTGQLIAVVLHKALQDALHLGHLTRNPAAAVERPKAPRSEMRAWSAAEAGAFLDVVAGDRLYAGWLVLLTRGLRRGELLGLRWVDVDLEGGRLSIRQTLVDVAYLPVFSEPKTAKGRRTVPLDADLALALRAHRRAQLEERLAWGEAWQDTGLVFTREDGAAIHPQRLSQMFERLVRRAELRPIRLHDLRHTAATLALGGGIPTRVVSEWLGHATTSITEDVYQHVVPSMLEEAGAKLTALISQHRSK